MFGERPVRKLSATVVLAAVGALALGSAIWMRATYGVWWIGTAPLRIPLCDMTYTRTDDELHRIADVSNR